MSSEYKKKTILWNTIGVLVSIWLLLLPFFTIVAFIVNMIVPIISVFFAIKADGAIGIDSRKWGGTLIPKIDIAILFPSFALILKNLLNFQLVSYRNIFIIAFVISVPILIYLFKATKEYLYGIKAFGGFVWGMIFYFTYGIGTVCTLNILLDRSDAKEYQSVITSKEIEKGKMTKYRIDFEPWGPVDEYGLMRISKYEWDALEVGDSINLYLRDGFFNVSWYNVP